MMRWFKKKLSTSRVYGPAILLYSVIAAYFFIPAFQQVTVAGEVKNHLDTVIHNSVQSDINVTTGHPKTMSIDRLDIKLSIHEGIYDKSTKTWTLDQSNLFVSTLNNANPIVSTSGTKQPLKVVFYGHNTDRVLLKTSNLTVGDILKINTAEGGVLTYYYVGDKYIAPESAGILRADRDETPIVLITCDGLLSTTRRVMFFAQIGTTNKFSYKKESF